MKVLAFQLKRIGDLILTTPALMALKAAGAETTLVVEGGCATLAPAIPGVVETLVHTRKGNNRALWRRLGKRGWDVALDFTGTDRSALMGWFSRTPRRITFSWVREKLLRRLAYQEFVDSPVRLAHTADHYLDLLHPLGFPRPALGQPALHIPREAHEKARELLAAAGVGGGYVLLHPGTARPEKYWLPECWAEVIARLRALGLPVAITTGPDSYERAHVARILDLAAASDGTPGAVRIAPPDLLTLAAVVEKARLVLSCDTAVVHLAAAFERPQVALFGPTNPFHWRPRHDHARVISATLPEEPLLVFQPKMRGAPTAQIPTKTVLAAAESLLPATSASGGMI
jgi:ADP-heptose:LPS heptosyltransferase